MKQIAQARLVPVAVIDRVEDAIPLAEALQEGGLEIIEVTFRTAAAPEAIRNIRARFPSMLVGAGTLLDIYQVEKARDAGAMFGVAPGINESVVMKALSLEMPFLPGVMTPSEVERGLSLGCQMLKFFPAEASGGIPMLKALAGPFGHTGLKFIPLGGVNNSNAAAYLELPMVAAVGGSWFLDRKFIAAGDWEAITRMTREAAEIAKV